MSDDGARRLESSRWPYLNYPGPIAFAHRGGAIDAAENTMPAFEMSVELGFRYVETDVHVTADGVLVAFHDDDLSRVTDRSGIIGELPWAEVQKARVDGLEPIPLLEDILGTWPELRINIDPKRDEAVDALAAVIKRTSSEDRVCVGAFSDRRIDRVRKLVGEDLCTGLGPRRIAALRAASVGVPTPTIIGGAAQVPVKQGPVPIVDRRFVAEAHRRGLHVHVWTIDDPDEMRSLLDLGVDGLMTDRPAVLRDVLVERGEWA